MTYDFWDIFTDLEKQSPDFVNSVCKRALILQESIHAKERLRLDRMTGPFSSFSLKALFHGVVSIVSFGTLPQTMPNSVRLPPSDGAMEEDWERVACIYACATLDILETSSLSVEVSDEEISFMQQLAQRAVVRDFSDFSLQPTIG